MAKELRFETLVGNTADGTTSENADNEFRNDSSQIIHIREITFNACLRTAAPDELAIMELSKSPTYSIGTTNNVFYTLPMDVRIGATGATPVDGAIVDTKFRRYARGQLTLEPNESLFVNTSKSSGGLAEHRIVIGYEF